MQGFVPIALASQLSVSVALPVCNRVSGAQSVAKNLAVAQKITLASHALQKRPTRRLLVGATLFLV
jgi:hypothetical protein